jgi:hypothetical protein
LLSGRKIFEVDYFPHTSPGDSAFLRTPPEWHRHVGNLLSGIHVKLPPLPAPRFEAREADRPWSAMLRSSAVGFRMATAWA